MFISEKQVYLDPDFKGHFRMPAAPDPTLPIIDLRPLGSGNVRNRTRTIEELGAAACDTGFLYISHHGIGEQTIANAYDAARRFFALPESEKLRYYIGLSSNHRGYVPFFEQGAYADEGKRRYEAFDMAVDLAEDDPDYLLGHPMIGPNIWPEVDGFRHAIETYYRELTRLATTLCGAFEAYLGLESGFLSRIMKRPTSQLRLLHYIRNDLDDPAARGVNMGAHTDYEFFTILHQSRPALYVMDRNDNWMCAPPIPGTFVMHIGDMLEVLSNGLFRATPHKVVNDGQERFSMPFFCAADFDAVIEPAPALVRSMGMRRYEPYVAGHHLFTQLLRDFPYLRRRYANGEIPLDLVRPDASKTFEERIHAVSVH